MKFSELTENNWSQVKQKSKHSVYNKESVTHTHIHTHILIISALFALARYIVIYLLPLCPTPTLLYPPFYTQYLDSENYIS